MGATTLSDAALHRLGELSPTLGEEVEHLHMNIETRYLARLELLGILGRL